MGFITAKGTEYIGKIMSGGYPTAVAGVTKIGVYGSTSGAADALIGSLQAINFSASTIAGGFASSLYLATGESNPAFTIPEDTIVKGWALYSSDVGETFGDEIFLEDMPDREFSTGNPGTLTITDPSIPYNIVNATIKGSYQICKALAGDDTTGYAGYDKAAIYGSINGAADAIIGSLQTITWGTPDSDGVSYTAQDFDIASANTVIKKVLLFDTVNVGSTYGDEVATYTLPTYNTYEAAGTFRIGTLNYKVS